jgi:hypothetical protein
MTKNFSLLAIAGALLLASAACLMWDWGPDPRVFVRWEAAVGSPACDGSLALVVDEEDPAPNVRLIGGLRHRDCVGRLPLDRWRDLYLVCDATGVATATLGTNARVELAERGEARRGECLRFVDVPAPAP